MSESLRAEAINDFCNKICQSRLNAMQQISTDLKQLLSLLRPLRTISQALFLSPIST